MLVIPVLDVRLGRAVRALAGDRAHYGPLRSVLHDSTDPIALARAGLDRWGLPDLYLADLDAILGESSPDLGLFRTLADLGLVTWVDAGVRDAVDLAPLLDAGVSRVIVGLETVRGPDALAEIVAEAGPERVVFSLDLRRGRPMVDTQAAWRTDRPPSIAARAIEAGVRRFIFLDLDRVGTGRGVEAGRFDEARRQGGEWIVGGGISGASELRQWERAGASGVLVGSALHDGRIAREDLATLQAGKLTTRDHQRARTADLPPLSPRERGRG